MLPKNSRLQKKKDIERVFKKGKGFKEGFLILKTVKNNSKESRFGFLVSQKVSKKAVVRNKTKRRLRNLVAEKLKLIKPGTDNLFIASPGTEEKSFLEIKKEIDSLFKKAKILRIEYKNRI